MHFLDVFLNDKLYNFFPKEIYMVHWECCQVRNYPNRNYAKLDSISPPQFGRSSAANTALSKNLSKHIRKRKFKHNQQEKIYPSTTNKRFKTRDARPAPPGPAPRKIGLPGPAPRKASFAPPRRN